LFTSFSISINVASRPYFRAKPSIIRKSSVYLIINIMIEPTYIFIKLLLRTICAISIWKKKTPITQNARLRTRSRCALLLWYYFDAFIYFSRQVSPYGRETHRSGIIIITIIIILIILYCLKFKSVAFALDSSETKKNSLV